MLRDSVELARGERRDDAQEKSEDDAADVNGSDDERDRNDGD